MDDHPFIKFCKVIGMVLLCLFVLWLVVTISSYHRDLYHRKYPNTTTIDWLLDSGK